MPPLYRPISLLPTFSKLLEEIILSRLQDEIIENRVLTNKQFGFRQGPNTTPQALRLVEKIYERYHNHDKTVVAFLEIAKAFDRVWKDELLYKMSRARISRQLVKIIQSFLDQRTVQVRINGMLSSER